MPQPLLSQTALKFPSGTQATQLEGRKTDESEILEACNTSHPLQNLVTFPLLQLLGDR